MKNEKKGHLQYNIIQILTEGEKALSLYGRRNNVERVFNALKNRLDGDRLRTHPTDAASGELFLPFISLILYSALDKLMRDKKVYNKYTISGLLEMLKNIRIVKLQSGFTYLTEIPKKAMYTQNLG